MSDDLAKILCGDRACWDRNGGQKNCDWHQEGGNDASGRKQRPPDGFVGPGQVIYLSYTHKIENGNREYGPRDVVSAGNQERADSFLTPPEHHHFRRQSDPREGVHYGKNQEADMDEDARGAHQKLEESCEGAVVGGLPHRGDDQNGVRKDRQTGELSNHEKQV